MLYKYSKKIFVKIVPNKKNDPREPLISNANFY